MQENSTCSYNLQTGSFVAIQLSLPTNSCGVEANGCKYFIIPKHGRIYRKLIND